MLHEDASAPGGFKIGRLRAAKRQNWCRTLKGPGSHKLLLLSRSQLYLTLRPLCQRCFA